ncbi:hypothetical protein MO867_21665 [Microbulbifer sp. OS29]|uniref:Solute-binding protein family 3/N-terminal domain-containing protein n=1 Tax=Microbulbifer okhotskensis TaxID=2926617 RepID=A0A9X2ESD7_9GAMM|nr:hypothetical protein [Microbulbifer okhotskensis]MCO1336939.1 hypothetical protein [Microbulbifer okhotskensis]
MQNKSLKKLLLLAILFGYASFAVSAKPSNSMGLKVAIEKDAPPYVDNRAKRGLEVDVILKSLPGYSITFIQLGWGKIPDAMDRGIANAEANSIKHDDPDKYYYSSYYIGFVNYAISHKGKGYKIDSVDDLVGHDLIVWKNAHLVLGPEFKRLFSPDASGRKNYVETQNSKDQVLEFWNNPDSIIIIDKSIFMNFSIIEGHSMNKVDIHKIFLPVTKFKMAFKGEKARDDFNKGLALLCSKGEYANMLKEYGVPKKANVCP